MIMRPRSFRHLFLFTPGIIPIRSRKLYRLRAVAGRSTRLALVWGFYPQRKNPSDTVFAAMSTDNGATWRSPTMGLLPVGLGGFAWFSQTQDNKGDIHLAAASANPGTGEGFIYYSVLSNESWRPFTLIPTGPVASAITLSWVQPGGLLLMWGNARPAAKGDARPAPVTMYTFITRTCSRQ